MSGGGGKGGSKTQSVQIPAWAEDAAKKNLAMAENASQIGYMPYYGLDVAAQTPTQQAANQAAYGAAAAMGIVPQGMNANAGMPTAQTVNGVTGYSSGSLFDQAVAELTARRPNQVNTYNSMFVDPVNAGMTEFNKGYVTDSLVESGYSPQLASAIASGDSSGIETAANQAGMSGSMIQALRSLPNNPLMPLGMIGTATNALADYYAGSYGREGNPNVYGNDTFYRAGGVPTPVRGSDFYSSSEAQSNRDSVGVSGGGYVGSGGGNASRGFTSGGW